MLINLSNHPWNTWDKKQIQTALSLFGNIVDLPFPAVDPAASSAEVKKMAQEYLNRIVHMLPSNKENKNSHAVHIQGEFTFVYHLVSLLKAANIMCVASTSERDVTEKGNGEKLIKFTFIQFREY